MRFFLAALGLVLAISPIRAATWKKLDGCRLVKDAYMDGDSFHVVHKGKEFIFRLYFVDACETDTRYPDRVAEQAGYFGVSSARTLALGARARTFTVATLSKPFTVYTRWEDARGSSSLPRYYAIARCRRGDLASLLTKAGLVRIYGMKTTLPGGQKAERFIASLKKLERTAKALDRGGWK